MRRIIALLMPWLLGVPSLAWAQDVAAIPPAAEDTDSEALVLDRAHLDCTRPLFASDVLKDFGHTIETEVITLTASTLADAQERALALDTDAHIEAMLPLADEPEWTVYLNDLLARLTPYVSRDLPWEVRVFTSSEPNAYALPGGRIYVSSAMLNLITNEAQMVAILAHELAHHEQRHVLAHVQYLKVLGAWDAGQEGDGASVATAVLGGSEVMRLMAMPFRSHQEEDADRFAVELTMDAGYSPLQVITLMMRVERFYERGVVDAEDSFAGYVLAELRNVIDDHPRARLRACTIADILERRGLPVGAEAAGQLPAHGVEEVGHVGSRNFATRTAWEGR